MVLLAWVASVPQAAAEGVNAQVFAPAEDGGAFITSHDSQVLGKQGLNAGLFLNYSGEPLIAVDSVTGKESPVLESLTTADAFVTYGFHPIFQASVAVPFNLPAGSSPLGKNIGGAAMGDIRLKAKMQILDREKMTVGLALLPYVNIPSGKAEAYVGDGSVTGGGNLAADIALPGIIDRSIVVGANAGVFGRKPASGGGKVELGSQMSYGLAVNVPVAPVVDVVIDSYGRTLLGDPFGEIAGTPFEVDAGVHLLTWRNKGIRLTAGAGKGLTQGVGSPAYRVFSGIVLSAPAERADRDHDGFLDEDDECPDEPEDVIGYQAGLSFRYLDQDGCPDGRVVVVGRILDADTGSAVTAAVELAPEGMKLDAPGTYRFVTKGPAVDRKLIVTAPGFEPQAVPLDLKPGESRSLDVLLQPLLGRVRGSVIARDTGRPLTAKIHLLGRTSQAADGLFELVLPRHAAPLAVTISARGYLPETTAWLVAPGAVSDAVIALAPNMLTQAARVVDAGTLKPLPASVTLPTQVLPLATDSQGGFSVTLQEDTTLEATVFANGYLPRTVTFTTDATGETLVPLRKKEIQVVAKKLVLDPIYFENNKAVILENSYAPLDAVAEWLVKNPDITLRIEGHTDDVGNDAKNLRLSKQRAASVVEFLVSRGVDKSRLKSNGFGEKKPIAPNDSEAGRAKNRRVEFIVDGGDMPQ